MFCAVLKYWALSFQSILQKLYVEQVNFMHWKDKEPKCILNGQQQNPRLNLLMRIFGTGQMQIEISNSKKWLSA